jgi:hypothetical protein
MFTINSKAGKMAGKVVEEGIQNGERGLRC